MEHKYMSIAFKTLFADKIVKQSGIASSVLLLLALLYLAVLYRSLPPFVPLFNQLPWGTERLGSKVMVFLPVVSVLVLFAVNMLVSRFIYEKMPLVVRMIGITTFFISVITFIFIIRITLLVL
jgi:hypothetical protein